MVFFRLLTPLGIDFPQFFEAAYLWSHGGNPYLHLITSSGPFNYPPTIVPFLFLYGLLPFSLAAIVWNLSSLAALIISLYLITDLLFSQKHLFAFIVSLGFFTLPFFPVKYNLDNGQINHFILMGLIVSLYYQSTRPRLAAFSLASTIALKLIPVIFILPLLVNRDFKYLRQVIFYLGLIILATLCLIPLTDLSFYFKIFFTPFTLTDKAVYYNQSLLALLSRQLPVSWILVSYLTLGVVALLLSLSKLAHQSFIFQFSLTSCLMLLFHPLSWQHHYVFSLIPLIYLWSRQQYRLVALSYALINLNLEYPQLIPPQFSFLLSSQTLGVLLLYLRLMWK